MAYFPVSLNGFHFQDSQFTYLLEASITKNDIGKAVSRDTSAANTVKLAGDGDVILGRLETFEDRTVEGVKVGTVSRQFLGKLPSSGAIAVGAQIQGAGAGLVKSFSPGIDDLKDHSRCVASSAAANNEVIVECGF